MHATNFGTRKGGRLSKRLDRPINRNCSHLTDEGINCMDQVQGNGRTEFGDNPTGVGPGRPGQIQCEIEDNRSAQSVVMSHRLT